MSLGDLIGEFLSQVAPREAEVIEQACEMALQTGFMGVLVTRSIEHRGDQMVWVLTAEATPDVPYGYIRDNGRDWSMGIR